MTGGNRSCLLKGHLMPRALRLSQRACSIWQSDRRWLLFLRCASVPQCRRSSIPGGSSDDAATVLLSGSADILETKVIEPLVFAQLSFLFQ